MPVVTFVASRLSTKPNGFCHELATCDAPVSLLKLADFLASRGQSGDATQAMGHYERSLAVSERLLLANPESAEANRDVTT